MSPSEGGFGMRSYLRAGRTLTAVLVVATLTLAGATAAAPPPSATDNRSADGLLGLVGMDHVGITVPNIADAIRWFHDVMGCETPLTFGPFSGVDAVLDVDPATVIDQITHVRCGRSASIELFQYEAPEQRLDPPRNSDYAGYHIAFYVTDLVAAADYLEDKGVRRLLGPLPVTEGPAAGETINYFQAPWGTYIELISYPDGMAYESDPSRPLWSPKRNGLDAVVTGVPGLLGIDHVGITVPSVGDAVAWFEDVLGCTSPLAFGPFSGVDAILDVHPDAVVQHIQHVRCGNGPSVELFQYASPDQDTEFRRNSDIGGKHLAFYVRHIDKAVATMQTKGVEKLAGPLAVTAGPAAGQTINYFRTPFGTYLELISYPHGMAYEDTVATPLWDPRDNRP